MSLHIKIERNGVEKVTKPFKFIRGENKDKEFPSIEVAPSEHDILATAKWLGLETAAGAFTRLIKAAAQVSFFDSFNEDGQFDENKFTVLMKEFTSVSLKKSELEDRKDELMARLLVIADKISVALDNNDYDTVRALDNESKDIKAQIRVTQDAILQKSRQKKGESAEPAVAA